MQLVVTHAWAPAPAPAEAPAKYIHLVSVLELQTLFSILSEITNNLNNEFSLNQSYLHITNHSGPLATLIHEISPINTPTGPPAANPDIPDLSDLAKLKTVSDLQSGLWICAAVLLKGKDSSATKFLQFIRKLKMERMGTNSTPTMARKNPQDMVCYLDIRGFSLSGSSMILDGRITYGVRDKSLEGQVAITLGEISSQGPIIVWTEI